MTSPKRLIAGIVIGVLGLMAHTSTAATWHVSPTGDDANDGATWATAKQTIQAGVDAAASYDTVLVNDGTYVLTGQVTVYTPINIRSVNGPEATIVYGNGQVTSNRCFYLGSDCTLDGFTVRNGLAVNARGGGIYCVTEETVVTNCIIANNEASENGYGGGVFAGLLYNCIISNNYADSGGGCFAGILNNCTITNNSASSGGGAYNSALNNCTINGNIAYFHGGGTRGGILNNCTINGNIAYFDGGGACDGILNNCTITDNTANYGGGAYNSALNNCTITDNTANYGGGSYDGTLNNCIIIDNIADYGGGSRHSTLNNCTIIRNTALSGSGAEGGPINNCIIYYNYGLPQIDGWMNYSCSLDAPIGNGNITNAPLFVDKNNGNFRLSAISPCINQGDNQYAPTNVTPLDLDGNTRIFNGTVDMGAYEYGSVPPALLVATPVFSPDGGVYSASMIAVTVSCATAGATIRYTTNGSDPTESSSTVTSGSSVPVPVPGTLKAKAWKTGLNPSAVKSANYTFLNQPPAAPDNVSASDGTHTNKITVEWTVAAGATGYRIFRHTNDLAAAAEEIGTSSTTTYNDRTAIIGKTYYYWVKAVNAVGASAFSAPDTGYLGVIGPLVTANGMVGDNIRISAADPVTIAVEMMNLPPEYLGFNVDWWVAAYIQDGGLWFYFDSAINLTPFDGNLANCRPAYQGPLSNLPPQTLVENMLLPPGAYNVWFAVDYPMDGILGLGGANLMSLATIVVEWQ